jgi:hypothetical protein
MKSTNLIILGGAVVLGGLYLNNKSKKDKALADAKALALNVKPVIIESKYYTSAEATKKALDVVTKWISLLDTIPKEFLTQENKNIINQRIREEKAKQDRIDYNEALALAKSTGKTKFTFQDRTFWTANQEDVRNGSFSGSVWVKNPNSFYFTNQFNNINSQILEQIKNVSFFNVNNPATLGDYIKVVKTQQFSEIYNKLKIIFTELIKSDVDRLVQMLPKYLMANSDDFAYFQTEYEKNPFTIEEQLYLKDINIDNLLTTPKTPIKFNSLLTKPIKYPNAFATL